MIRFRTCLSIASALTLASVLFQRGAVSQESLPGDKLLQEFFATETRKITEQSLAEIETLEDWTSTRDESVAQLKEMLGLSPLPERTPLKPVVTGSHTREGIVVENLHFQSSPGLYVTANLYRPEQQNGPLPAILYVCGHGRTKIDGVSYGNKVNYQHHGAWFARNGYVCLTIDTIQLGEIEGLHHGTYREGMWWWHNRGYTPAGVEAWNGIRALDYLQSRPEVDGEKIGMTGRSGGGIYTWWVAALDERVKVAVPVAGITSIHNHIVDGCIEGHCDCMYMVNTYQWDFPQLAALVAPRALLISNTDKDRIFPLDGVVDVYFKTRRIYELYDAIDHIGLNIAEGPHKDTQELRVNAFHWMNRFLKNDDPLIEMTATKLFTPQELKVFDELPDDERVTTIHESFVPVSDRKLPETEEELVDVRNEVVAELKETSFRNWPNFEEIGPAKLELIEEQTSDGFRIRRMQFRSDHIYTLPIIIVGDPQVTNKQVIFNVCDESWWKRTTKKLEEGFLKRELAAGPQIYLAPRGVGPTRWSGDERKQTHIKRRFALLGHTEDSLRIFDIVRGIDAVCNEKQFEDFRIHLLNFGDDFLEDFYVYLMSDDSDRMESFVRGQGFDETERPHLLCSAQIAPRELITLLGVSRSRSIAVIVENESQLDQWESIKNVANKFQWIPNRFGVFVDSHSKNAEKTSPSPEE